MPSRRSRYRQVSTGKRLMLTPRDLDIFRALARYRYLNTNYLHGFAGGASEKRFVERLGDLFHEGYIGRPSAQWQYASALASPTVYEIATGARHLLDQRDEAVQPRTYLGAGAHRQFLHAAMICQVLASIELEARASDSARFIPWSEILARAPEETKRSSVPFRVPVAGRSVVPDGLFGLEYRDGARKSYRFFALEVDRGTMPVTRSESSASSIAAKFDDYRELVASGAHKAHWGISTLVVLMVTTGRERLGTMLKAAKSHAAAQIFLCQALGPQTLSRPWANLYRRPWARAGHIPVSIESNSG